ncbi:MAG: efflux RND transporter permease subunit [Phycicoccus sp.]
MSAGIRARVLVTVLVTAAAVFGAVQLAATPVEPVPEFAPVTVEVQSEALGLSAQEVEDLVTVPLESNLLSGVAWVDRMTSSSIPGLSSVVMTFEEGTDPVRARQVVQERLTQGALLTNASKAPVMLQPTSSANRVMMIGLSSPDRTLVDLSVLSRWTIRPKLMSVQGVANVSVWGMRDRQLHVLADPARMQQRGVTLDELVATTGNALWVSPLSFLEASTPGRGGFLDLPQQRVNVQHVSPITDSAALGRVAVEGSAAPSTLAEVADIVDAPPTIIGDGVVGDRSGLVLVVEKQPGTSTAEVSAGVESALASLSAGLPGVTLDTGLYRPADYVADVRRGLALAALLALAVAGLVGAVVYRAWRPVVVVVSSVATSAVAGWLVLWYRDAPVTQFALTGLAAGAVLAVALAATAVDGVARTPAGRTVSDRVAAAYGDLGLGAVYVVVAALLLTAPVFLLDGRAGAFLPEAATGFVLATTGSLVTTVLVAPALAALVGPGATTRAIGPVVLAPRVRSVAGRLSTSGPALLAVLVVGVVGSLALAASLGTDLRPAFQERTLVIHATAPEGTSPQALSRTLATASARVRELDGVAGVGGHVGRAVTGERVVGANSGELWVTLGEGADRDAVREGALDATRAAGDLDVTASTFLDGRLDAIVPAAAAPLVVSVYGPEPTTLRATAGTALDAVSGTDGVSGARVLEPPTEQNLQITVDLAAVEKLGMTPGDVRRQAATLVGGLEVGAIFEEQKVFDVQVWSGENLRDSPEKVGALPIDTPTGTQVPLDDIATVEVTEQATVIARESVQRRLDIVAEVSGDGARDEVRAALARLRLPAEYHAEVREESALTSGGRRAVLLVGGAVVLGILLLLQAAMRNWWTATLATLSVPLGLTGGLVAALFVGDLTVGAILGLLAVAVLGVHHALVVLRHARAAAEGGPDPTPAVVTGAVLPGTALTVLTALAVAALGPRPGLEAVHDLAVVLTGGALTAGLVAVLVLPAVALRYGRREEPVGDLSFDEAALGRPAVGSHA